MAGLLKPKPTPIPTPVPLPDEQAIDAARRRSTQQSQAASGSRSTRLTPSPTQAGTEFNRSTLG